MPSASESEAPCADVEEAAANAQPEQPCQSFSVNGDRWKLRRADFASWSVYVYTAHCANFIHVSDVKKRIRRRRRASFARCETQLHSRNSQQRICKSASSHRIDFLLFRLASLKFPPKFCTSLRVILTPRMMATPSAP